MNIQSFQDMIAHVGSNLQPNEDWMPVLFLEKDGHAAVVGVPELGETEEQKDRAAAMIFTAIAITVPDSVAWLTTAWTIPEKDRPRYLNAPYTRPSKHPERIEIVSVVCIDRKEPSDQRHKQAFMIGYIERSKDNPPKIPKWDVHEEPDMEMMGRFPEAIKMGLEKAVPGGNLDMLKKIGEKI